MRYLFGFVCVCALSLVPLVGCGSEAASLCEGVECEDDGNECTDGVCDPATGRCQHLTVEDDTACDFDGLPGLCKAGVCVDAECTNGVEDGTACSGGICRDGVCGPICVANVCHCSEAGIRAAIEGGGDYPYTFDCDGPTTVMTDAEIEIDNDVILDGEGNLTVDANEAHRIFSVASDVTAELRGMTVTRGSANGDGGGIHNDGTLALTNTTVSSNTASSDGGGIWNQGALTLVESTVSDNTAATSAGGIQNRSGTVELNRSTVSGNTTLAGGGGAIESGGDEARLLLVNTTVSGNFTTPGRGAIENDAEAVVLSSTLQQLPAEGDNYLWAGSGWTVFRNSILSGQCAGWSPVYSDGGNIESPGDSCGLWYYEYYEDWVFVSEAELNLGPLEDNGGPTLTHLPGTGSVAIDRIEPWACTDFSWEPLQTDQRGVGRPQGELCDVGSVEAPSLCGGVDCDDQNECTRDRCNPADASCSWEPVPDDPYMYCDLGAGGSGGSGGNGGIGGSVPGVCFQGECIPDLCAGNPCDDGNDCTWDDCSFPDGSCSYTNVPDGYSCMNGAGQCLGGACELLYALCGAERSIPPTATTDSRLLNCEPPVPVGFPVQIVVTMAATPLSAVQEGPNDFETQFEFRLTAETVNDILQFGFSAFRVESLGATIDATEGDSNPTPVLVSESPVPCIGLLEWDTAQSIVTPTIDATWTLDDGLVLELTAQQFEEIVTANGITQTLTTEGPYANCVWDTLPPAVSFTVAP